jgi:hypothetical protein
MTLCDPDYEKHNMFESCDEPNITTLRIIQNRDSFEITVLSTTPHDFWFWD